MSIADRHSRSRLAGYSAEVMESATVLVVGCGALGQNIVLDLALAGLGRLVVVDFDVFADHNLTRSPLYPCPADLAVYGLWKAPGIAATAHRLMTATKPRVDSYARCATQCSP